MDQTTIPENLSETATSCGFPFVRQSCYYHVSEITHSGSPLIPSYHEQQSAKFNRKITSDAVNTHAVRLLQSTEPGIVMTTGYQELQQMYGHDQFYTDKVKSVRGQHYEVVSRGNNFSM